jgi:electron transport complex protein RnfG
MKDSLRLVLVLTVICVAAGALLAWINQVTQAPIASAAREEKVAAIKKVLPACDNSPDADSVTVKSGGRDWTFYVARQSGRYVGAAFEATTAAGYGGTIRVMVGIAADGTSQGLEVLEHKETPGLGAKITEPAFKNQFKGRDLVKTTWGVRKDQGDIDEITAATISSRAVVEAVKEGLDVYLEHKDTIRTP